MDKRKDRKLDRHVNSRNYGLRLDNDMLERLARQAEKEGRSKRAIIIELLDDYLSKHGDWKNPMFSNIRKDYQRKFDANN